jgi:hypothetical protein
MTWEMKNRPVGGRSSETSSHPIDVNNNLLVLLSEHDMITVDNSCMSFFMFYFLRNFESVCVIIWAGALL